MKNKLLALVGCGKERSLGGDNRTDSDRAADMCDDCCNYFQCLNGCLNDH